MFGIYARNIINCQNRYTTYNEELNIEKQKKDRFKEGKELYQCYCKPGSCNPNRNCYYINEKYWSNEQNDYLPLNEFLFGDSE